MLPSWLEETLKQIPAFAALIWLVHIQLKSHDKQVDRFLVAQKEQRDAGLAERNVLMDRIHTLHEEHIAARTEARMVIEKLEQSIDKFSSALHEVSLAVATCPLKK